MKKTFINSIILAVASLSLIASCSSMKKSDQKSEAVELNKNVDAKADKKAEKQKARAEKAKKVNSYPNEK